MPRGGKRDGAGAPRRGGPTKTEQIGTNLYPTDAATLRQYPLTRMLELLASGLKLGAGNLPELSDTERRIIRAAMSGSADALRLRHLADEVADMEMDGAAELAHELAPLGDWELLVLVLGAQ